MGNFQQSLLKTLKQGASSSKKEDSRGQVPPPNTEKKPVPPAQKRPRSPPPAYTSQAPGAMPAAPFEEAETEPSGSRRDKDRGRKSRDDDVARYGQPSPRRNRSPSEHSRDRAKGKEVARRKKSRRDRSESEPESKSETESEDERRRKSKSKKGKGKEEKAPVRRTDAKRDKKGKSKKKLESGSEDDSDAEIVETRKRYEAVTVDEVDTHYLRALMDIFQVNKNKTVKWCDQELIRIDTKTGYYNLDKLVKSGKVEPEDVKKWAIFEKKFNRELELEGHELGMMSSIPRFQKYTKAADLDYVERSRPRSRGGHPGYHEGCDDCYFDDRYCGDQYHGGIFSESVEWIL